MVFPIRASTALPRVRKMRGGGDLEGTPRDGPRHYSFLRNRLIAGILLRDHEPAVAHAVRRLDAVEVDPARQRRAAIVMAVDHEGVIPGPERFRFGDRLHETPREVVETGGDVSRRA